MLLWSFLPTSTEKQPPDIAAALKNAFDPRAKCIHGSERIMASRKEVQMYNGIMC
jgi:hypothetical protein